MPTTPRASVIDHLRTLPTWLPWLPLGLVAALVLIDAGFVAVHVLGRDDPGRWALDLDRGYPEMFGYAKAIAAAAVLFWVARRTGAWAFGGMAVILVLIAIDDAFSVHETAGDRLDAATSFEMPLGLRPNDLGELGAWALLALVAAAVLVIGYRRATDPVVRQSVVWFAVLLVALAAVAAGLDMLHQMATGRLDQVLGLAEDGGELVVLSALVGFAVAVHRRTSARADEVTIAEPIRDERAAA